MRRLVRIIRSTNLQPSDRSDPNSEPVLPPWYEADIRQIDEIMIGRWAKPPTSNVNLHGAAPAGQGVRSGGGTGPRRPTPSATRPEYDEEGGFSGGGSTEVGSDPAEERYVDMNDQPLSAQQLRAAAQSEKAEDAALGRCQTHARLHEGGHRRT